MNQKNTDKTLLFLKSTFALHGRNYDNNKVISWLEEQNNKVKVHVKRTTFNKLVDWNFDNSCACIKHITNKFFSIEGIQVYTNWGIVNDWQQPIINQPEIGFLGIITKELNGILHFLLQAKIEPGNINSVQLSPTLQATRSNYTQVHKGKKPLYLDYFKKAPSDQILLDQLQSEQGARFLKKRNRNIIIKVENEIPVYENFIWLTLGQIKKLMQYDNLVNMDTRTVISGITFGDFSHEITDFFNFLDFENTRSNVYKDFLKSALIKSDSLHSIETIITFLTRLKSIYDLNISSVSIKDMKNWVFDDFGISHEEQKYFRVIAVDVEIENREVRKWSQPMIEPAQEGLCAIVCKKLNGIIHLAIQAKLECGNHDIIEFAPTVQCLTGNYRKTKPGTLPFLEYVLNAKDDQIIIDTYQSEEGGRFYHEQNRNLIVIAEEDFSLELPDNYIWMTLNQLYTFLKFNNYLNIQLRSLIAAIPFS